MKGAEEIVGNMDITLSYDPSVLEVREVVKGSLTKDSLFEYNILQGITKISLADREGFTGDGSVLYLNCHVIGPEFSSSPLEIEEVSAHEENYEALALPTVNGSFEVTASGTFMADCNGDRKTTVVDALCVLQMAVGKRAENLDLDINGDGKITSLDAKQILMIAVQTG